MKVGGENQIENGQKRIFATEAVIQRIDENPSIADIELNFFTPDLLDINRRHGRDR